MKRTANIRDGSMFTADMAIHNFVETHSGEQLGPVYIMEELMR